MAPPDKEALDPEAAQVLTKVRRLMAISVLLTGLAIASVLAVVGYRMATAERSAMPAPEARVRLPAGAKVVATAIDGDRLLVTVEAGGRTELHLFDANTLQPRGRLTLSAEP